MDPIHASDRLEGLGLMSAKDVLAYASAGVETVADLLDRFPKRYEDRRRFDAFPVQAGSGSLCLRGTVVDTKVKRFGGRKSFFEAVVFEAGDGMLSSNKIVCRWFNMPWMKNVLAAGHELVLFGKPKEYQGMMVMDHPDFEIEEGGQHESVHLERIVPVYKGGGGVAQRRQREYVFHVLEHIELEGLAAEYEVDATYPRHEALREVHFPKTMEEAEAARRFFALEEFFRIQLSVVWKRARLRALQGRVMGRKTALLTAFYHSLPFDLTDAQKRSVKEILADMRAPQPMSRLLQGDVGSGKTFVAMCAMLLAVDSGAQAALMAPTQILAEQHYLTFSRWLEPMGLRIALMTGSRKELEACDGEPQIIIGTHALLYDHEAFQDLGLVIIDEQHKFGVDQRARLIAQGVMPDTLVMTATPIPRTLTLTFYGDLDVSILDERPAGRGEVVTALRKRPKVSDIAAFLKQQLHAGRQAYLVYPLVEESEALDAAAATVEFEKWTKRLRKFRVGLLHGKMPADEKEKVMGAFRDGETDVLVSTTVIEVGVDVPNANVMVIHNAERFGLAQLHQLRGRIGRGEHKSFCILLTDGKSEEAMEKLQVMVDTSDGFKIAEADLRLRGPGDVLGTAQSGVSELRFLEFLADTALIREARELAEKLMAEDPGLARHPGLLAAIEERDLSGA
ncbi:ATP-dependent DNA helicase RecG [Oceaniferula marina]|nr:ATP-dependent DNA helicase RecG [Oceaniferula marina]